MNTAKINKDVDFVDKAIETPCLFDQFSQCNVLLYERNTHDVSTEPFGVG